MCSEGRGPKTFSHGSLYHEKHNRNDISENCAAVPIIDKIVFRSIATHTMKLIWVGNWTGRGKVLIGKNSFSRKFCAKGMFLFCRLVLILQISLKKGRSAKIGISNFFPICKSFFSSLVWYTRFLRCKYQRHMVWTNDTKKGQFLFNKGQKKIFWYTAASFQCVNVHWCVTRCIRNE